MLASENGESPIKIRVHFVNRDFPKKPFSDFANITGDIGQFAPTNGR